MSSNRHFVCERTRAACSIKYVGEGEFIGTIAVTMMTHVKWHSNKSDSFSDISNSDSFHPFSYQKNNTKNSLSGDLARIFSRVF